jgi:hypothetical protein
MQLHNMEEPPSKSTRSKKWLMNTVLYLI